MIHIKKILIALSAIIPFASGLAAEPTPMQNAKGKFGYADETGKFVISPQFDSAQPFAAGRAIVAKGGSVGVIDEAGKYVLPLKYCLISQVSEQMFLVAVDGKVKDGVMTGEKYGYVSASGDVVLEPIYINMSEFNNFGVATITDKNGHTGLINRAYQFVIPAQFSFISPFNSQGVAWANIGGSLDAEGKVNGGKFYVFTYNGDAVIPGGCKSAGYFTEWNWRPSAEQKKNFANPHDGDLWSTGNSHHIWRKTRIYGAPDSKLPENIIGWYTSSREDGSYNSVYTPAGELLIPENTFYCAFYPDEADQSLVVAYKEKQYNFINTTNGKPVLTSNVENMWGFRDGYAVCTVNGLRYIVDNKGGCCSAGYNEIFPRNGNTHVVRAGSSYGLIDYKGNVVITPTATKVHNATSEGLSLVETPSGAGFANEHGYVIEPSYYAAGSFMDGFAWVKDADGWQIILTDGSMAINEHFESGINLQPQPSHCWGKNKTTSKWECYDLSTGMKAFDADFSDVMVRTFNKDVAMVSDPKYSSLWGVVNMKGELIIPHRIAKANIFAAYDEYVKSGKKTWDMNDCYFFEVRNNPTRNTFQLNQTIVNGFWDF